MKNSTENLENKKIPQNLSEKTNQNKNNDIGISNNEIRKDIKEKEKKEINEKENKNV